MKTKISGLFLLAGIFVLFLGCSHEEEPNVQTPPLVLDIVDFNIPVGCGVKYKL